MEKILRIEECTFKANENDWGNYEGYQVVTDDQTIKVGISTGQSCCESYGYLTTNDDLKEFEGSELIELSVVDSAMTDKKIDELDYLGQGGAMFVNFKTTNGLFQLVAYNSHNGYYGHDAVLISKQINHTEIL